MTENKGKDVSRSDNVVYDYSLPSIDVLLAYCDEHPKECFSWPADYLAAFLRHYTGIGEPLVRDVSKKP